jgi:hypothetical protein
VEIRRRASGSRLPLRFARPEGLAYVLSSWFRLRFDAAAPDGRDECGVVALVLIRVGDGELRDSLVADLACARASRQPQRAASSAVREETSGF